MKKRVVLLTIGVVVGQLSAISLARTASAGVTVGVNASGYDVSHKSSNGVTIAFPDVCKTPSPAGPIPIPYPNIAEGQSKGSKAKKQEVIKVATARKGIVESKIAPATTQVNGATLEPIVANFKSALNTVESSGPKIPKKCTGAQAQAFWDDYIEWSETIAETNSMLRRFEIAAAMKANVNGQTKTQKTLAQSSKIAAEADAKMQALLLEASKKCALPKKG